MHTSILRGLALASVAVLSTVGASLGAASSAGAADTTTTFTITGGTGLSISAPSTTVYLGSANLDSTRVTSSLGTVRVDDTRAQLMSSWTATASATDFVYDQDADAETTGDRNVVAKAKVDYAPGLPTASSLLLNVPVPGTDGTMAAPRTAYTVVGVTGSNWVTWNPTITVNLPVTGKVAGTYTGTITHSVS